ncbi:DNA repair protein RecO [Aquisalimonas sp.]|uniref:DNA repair protein RecO n=1 Tax=Aquisalimonas sp. TaxID=1872621 RepID=UPI0025BB9EF1|nr:DNA repair protein RecO [Aquisalimonas sp.]
MPTSQGDQWIPAWVVHRRPYRDTSLLLELLTEEHGRVGAVARGARGQKSRWRGVLEPFQPVLVTWRGRGELATLTGAEAGGRPLRFQGTRLAAAFYLSELVLRLLRRENPEPDVFAAYGDALISLAAADAAEDAPLRHFEKRLLGALGYGLLLDTTADGQSRVEPGVTYRYELEYGPVPAAPGGSGLLISGDALLALDQARLDDPALRAEMQRLTSAALRLYIGDRPLQSRALYQSLRRRTGPGGEESAT